jgi:uncharacterized integral membrane protein
MASPYRRRRPSLVRNFWIYRRLVALAMVLGLMLWFIWANNTTVTVAFPFGLGKLTSILGLVILLSAVVGALVTALIFTMFFAVRRIQSSNTKEGSVAPPDLPDDRPPPDYAAKTPEGFDEAHWS